MHSTQQEKTGALGQSVNKRSHQWKNGKWECLGILSHPGRVCPKGAFFFLEETGVSLNVLLLS